MPAQRLQVFEGVAAAIDYAPFVIDFEPRPAAALDALPPVTLQRHHAQELPVSGQVTPHEFQPVASET